MALISVAAFVFTLTPAVAQEPDCQCRGTISQKNIGGDQAPLLWEYHVYLAERGGASDPIYCYLKQVSNSGSMPVHAISWPVAEYYRRILPAKSARATCTSVRGEVSASPVLGPLNYGASSESYDTTVYPPKGGWPKTAAQQILAPFNVQAARLDSVFSFDSEGTNGALSPTRIWITSQDFKENDGSHELEVVVLNKGDDAQIVSFQVNMSVTEREAKDFPFAVGPLTIKPGFPYKFIAHLDKEPVPESALVLVRDEKGQVAAIDRVGIYANAAGRKASSDDELWALARNVRK
jgi:hypothetical protein